MEDLTRKHRQEQKDLQARITQKKKSATKKTRKGVNDECAELERQLQERQKDELSACNSAEKVDDDNEDLLATNALDDDSSNKTNGVNKPLASLTISTPPPTTKGETKKPNRQKARLARRAAEQEAVAEEARSEATKLPNLRDQERHSMQEAFISRSLKEHEIRSDGHCLYAAIADQLQTCRVGLKPRIKIPTIETSDDGEPTSPPYATTRQVAAAYISQHSDDFVPFLEEPLDKYVKTIRETGEWGGHLEILALAKAYSVDINVLQGDGKIEKIECGLQKSHYELWLAYYRHSFGLGEHYNSLRRAE